MSCKSFSMTAAFTVSENDKAQSFDLGLDVSEGVDYFEAAWILGPYSNGIPARINPPRNTPAAGYLPSMKRGRSWGGDTVSPGASLKKSGVGRIPQRGADI
jgi:hypothetical protein